MTHLLDTDTCIGALRQRTGHGAAVEPGRPDGLRRLNGHGCSIKITEDMRKYAAEREYRVLRVVCDPRQNPLKIVTLHFDRSMKGKL
jgi:hypothetical protein